MKLQRTQISDKSVSLPGSVPAYSTKSPATVFELPSDTHGILTAKSYLYTFPTRVVRVHDFSCDDDGNVFLYNYGLVRAEKF